jgi:hypothetical protein
MGEAKVGEERRERRWGWSSGHYMQQIFISCGRLVSLDV